MNTNNKQPADAVPSLIAAKLRALIASGYYSPGSRLGQAELATQYSASRVPVREALKLLSAEGIIEHDPNRGFFVARFSASEAQQYFRLRDLVEDELLKSVGWPNEAELAEFNARSEELEQLLNDRNRAKWWDKNKAFHLALFDLSPHKVLVREAMRYWALTDRYRALLPLPQGDATGRSIVNKAELINILAKRDTDNLIKVRANRRHAFEEAVLSMLDRRGLD